uniref:Uncharacterized protein n=1 Tax=Oryza rufipogon TaxID=4529 RepID=A0A0E0P390_ORYRU
MRSRQNKDSQLRSIGASHTIHADHRQSSTLARAQRVQTVPCLTVQILTEAITVGTSRLQSPGVPSIKQGACLRRPKDPVVAAAELRRSESKGTDLAVFLIFFPNATNQVGPSSRPSLP